ncbi:MAG: acid phosphatase, partial [Acidobacteriota bacterium]
MLSLFSFVRPLRDPLVTSFVAALVVAGCATTTDAPVDTRIGRIGHVVVIYAENHSFDNLYGLFPGANGIAQATAEQRTQLDHDGTPLKELIVWGHEGKPDPKFPRMPNRPFRIDAPPVGMGPDKIVPSPIHAYYHNIEQINGGRNNLFAAMSQFGGWTMGYYDGSEKGSNFKLWKWAAEYTLADNFFMAAFGGSYLNHQWLICACTPVHPNASAGMHARLDTSAKLEKKPGSPSANVGAVKVFSSERGEVTPDGFSVNTSQPPYQPSAFPPAAGGSLDFADPKGAAAWGEPLPPQTARTIGDTLSARSISWAWYAGGWNQALADGRQPAGVKRKVIYVDEGNSPIFQTHHQPFNYYKRFAPGTRDRALHLKDGDDFLKDIAAGTLPAVSFYKPAGRYTQHPSYTDLKSGDIHMDEVLKRLRASTQWKDMLIVVTYDENGGYWDHVPPPSGPGWGDRWGPG